MAILATPHWVGLQIGLTGPSVTVWHSTVGTAQSAPTDIWSLQLPFVGDPTHRPQLQPLHLFRTVSAIPDEVAVASPGLMFSDGKNYDHIIICHKGQGGYLLSLKHSSGQ